MARGPTLMLLGWLGAGAALALAGCGKVGSPDVPPGSIYPKVYPADAVRLLAPAGPLLSNAQPRFTASGAWIDPEQRRQTIDPYVDTDLKGQGGIIGARQTAPSAATPPTSGAVPPPAVTGSEPAAQP